MRLKNKDITELQKLINNAKNITIATHINPDGDAIGSCCGLYHYLKLLSKNITIIIPNNAPSNLNFLLNNVNHIVFEENTKQAKQTFINSDLIFVMDMNNDNRSGDTMGKTITEMNSNKVLIDHHVNPDKYNVSFSYPDASSTCEVVFYILKKLSSEKIFNKDIATALYSGISTDTGSFSYSCNHSGVYTAVASLLKTGIKVNKIHNEIFNTYSKNRLHLLGYAISKKLKIFEQQRAAYIYLDKKELDYYHYQPGDLEGVVNYCLKLDGIDFCALLSERDNKIKMSFRSTDEKIDVNKFANKYWNGGGHVMASGGKGFESMNEVREKLEQQIKNMDFISKD